MNSQPPLILRFVSLLLLAAVLAPVPAHAGLLDIFKTINSTISEVIGGTLGQITAVQNDISSMTHEVLWPISAINQTKSWSRNVVNRYRGWMWTVYSVPLNSARLTAPRQLETALLSGNVSNLSNLAPGFLQTYGPMPTQQQAPIEMRQMMDMNDALAQGALKQTVASDQASAALLKIADDMENNATASPGTSSYVSASAYATTLQTLAYQHQLLAAQLRSEAAVLAHSSARVKRSAEATNGLNQLIQGIVTRR